MSTNGEPLSVKKKLSVEAPVERAWRVFTANMGAWWPKTHHIGKSELKDCVIEPKEGGRWYEITEDGATCEWGKVLVWEQPRRLVLAWQLDDEYKYDSAFLTEVEVRFTPVGAGRTQVDFEHRHLERFGKNAVTRRNSMDEGWGMILERFAGAARTLDHETQESARSTAT